MTWMIRVSFLTTLLMYKAYFILIKYAKKDLELIYSV